MSRRKLALAILFVLVAGLLAGCAGTQPTAAPAPEQPAGEPAGEPQAVALTVKGKVADELALSLDEFKALGVVEITAEHPKKGPQDYTGVLLQAVLDKAGVQDGAAELVITASDGFEATVALADLESCEDCLVALDGDSLSMVLPDQSSKAWVKDVVTLELK